jgi:hypothetical protein
MASSQWKAKQPIQFQLYIIYSWRFTLKTYLKNYLISLVSLAVLAVGAWSYGGNSNADPLVRGFIAGLNVLAGDDRERLINRVGSETIIDVGDSLRGVLAINRVTDETGLRLLGKGSDSDEVTATFQLLVVGKTATAIPGIFSFTLGPDPAFASKTGALTGTIVRAFTDDANDVLLDGAGLSLAASRASATGGDLLAELGFTGAGGAAGAGEGWTALGTDDLGTPASRGELVGTSNFALSRTSIGGSLGDASLTTQTSIFFGAGAEFIGGSGARGTAGLATPWGFTADTTIVMDIAD